MSSVPNAHRYGALGPGTLFWQLFVLVGAEVLIVLMYWRPGSMFHWSIHFLVGLTAAAVWNLAVLLVLDRPAPGQLASILLFHLIAMAPDLLFGADVAHFAWMDVFLGHISVHYTPGREWTWLVLALLATGVYVACLSCWIARRTDEAH